MQTPMSGAQAVAAAVAMLALAPGAAAWDGTWSGPHSYANGNHTRDYYVYVPPDLEPQPAMVVYLHGCGQTAEIAAVGTRFRDEADARRMIVVFPEQNTTPNQSQGNGIGCWNWFRPDHQLRGQGEPGTIAGITEGVAAAHGVDPRRIYIHGASAGADMAVIMAANYPDLYAALGALAGCPFLSCSDGTGELAYQAMGSFARQVPTIIGQGTADPINNFAAGEALVQQWLGTNDFADDGLANNSVSRVPASTESYSVEEGNGFAYDVQHFADSDPETEDCNILDFYIVHGLGHMYPGGDPADPDATAAGPDATAAVTEFFLAHPMADPGESVCTPLPEPGGLPLFASGAALLAPLARRRIRR